MREFVGRLWAFFKSSDHERDLDAEMKAHLAFAFEENIAAGMAPEEARRRAMIRFGGVEAAKELHRETRSLPFLEYLAQDLRYALRMMGRDRAFTLFALLIIALGIGASTTVFSVLRTVLVRPLPFRDPGNLVWLANSKPEEGLSAQTSADCLGVGGGRGDADCVREFVEFAFSAKYRAPERVGNSQRVGCRQGAVGEADSDRKPAAFLVRRGAGKWMRSFGNPLALPAYFVQHSAAHRSTD